MDRAVRALHIIIAMVMAMAIASCSRHLVTESTSLTSSMDKARVDTVRVMERSVDTIVERDSVVIERTGDTVTIRQVRWRERVSIIHDTVYQRSVDTVIAESREATATTTEPEPTFWDKVLEWLALVGCLALVGAVILWRTK